MTDKTVPAGQSIQDQLRAINEAANIDVVLPKKGGERPDEASSSQAPAAADVASATAKADDQAESLKKATEKDSSDNDELEDEDDDLDELDDMLDSFVPTKQTTGSTATAPNRPASSSKAKDSAATVLGLEDGFDEEEFIKQLEAGMAEMMSGGAAKEGNASERANTAADTSAAGASAQPEMSDWEAITKQMSEDPNTAELMKMLMGEGPQAGATEKQGPPAPSQSSSSSKKKPVNKSRPATASSANSMNAGKPEESFQDTIRKTMERMRESGDKATAAAAEDADGDMLTQLLKAMESGMGSGLAGGEGDGDGSLDKMLMGLMEQMTNKDILYDPMAELNTKFGPWLKENKGKVEESEYKRFEDQAAIVKEIVDKFEEKGYSDDKPEDRTFIWEKMQKMQATGGPPEDLVANPFGNEDSGLGEAFKNGAEEPGCPQQ
ncbi:Peroxisome chaperone and import receptor [Ascosphaera pollenicola]|nr:Peroxisome chaperone and import receptor [Ascosphaera pollenicola]